ncbi:MAG TPA: hypothetical protein VJZ71_03975 [Phycisphaerae bacterium]|nr:hypothetical protein [Phycisphaerae bacterium]
MSDAPRRSVLRPGRAPWKAVVAFVRTVHRLRIMSRLYAAALIAVIVWVTWLSLRYLLSSLAVDQPPAQIVALPTRLDRAALGAGRSAFAALDAAEHPRSPLAHYHRLDSWPRPDSFNDCARAGCHNPLPHSKKKEVRAFLNMHATSIHCGVCHFKQEDRPLSLAWYDLDNGETREPPSILRAYEMLTGPDASTRWKKAGREEQARLVALLRSASREAGGARDLDELANHFEAYRLDSPGFERLLADAPDLLPRHFRGEYGAKLAVVDGNGRTLRGHPNTESAVRQWLTRNDAVSEAERKSLLGDVHPLKRETALTCTDCHTAAGGLVDFAKAGYPPARLEQLVSPIVFRMIEHINAGRPFNLPAVLGGQPLPAQPQ